MQARFLTPIVVIPLDDGINWRLEHDLVFQDSDGTMVIVPAGFITDFASIPSISKIGLGIAAAGYGLSQFTASLPHVHWVGHALAVFGCWCIWIADSLNRDDMLDAPATVHEVGYRVLRGSTSHWDGVLYRAMGATRRPMWKRLLIWGSVAAFGWSAWQGDAKMVKQ